jgi:hypothetical protein
VNENVYPDLDARATPSHDDRAREVAGQLPELEFSKRVKRCRRLATSTCPIGRSDRPVAIFLGQTPQRKCHVPVPLLQAHSARDIRVL